jgi:hypothetical protein
MLCFVFDSPDWTGLDEHQHQPMDELQTLEEELNPPTPPDLTRVIHNYHPYIGIPHPHPSVFRKVSCQHQIKNFLIIVLLVPPNFSNDLSEDNSTSHTIPFRSTSILGNISKSVSLFPSELLSQDPEVSFLSVVMS